MKTPKSLLLTAVALAVVFAAGSATAFPLKLTSLTGTISATPSYGAIATTNKAQYFTEKFTLKTVTLLISNSLVRLGSNPPPADVYIAYELRNHQTYLTNSSGYYQNVSAQFMNYNYFVDLDVYSLAAKFAGGKNNTITEKDPVVTYFGFRCIGPDGGIYYAGANYGIGSAKYAANSQGVSLSISGTGPDEGISNSSFSGVSQLSFTFSGKNPTAEWNGPFYLWWEF